MIVSFLRHGSTLWNEQGRMQGRRDVPLSVRGHAQVRAWNIPTELRRTRPVRPLGVEPASPCRGDGRDPLRNDAALPNRR